jgi:hypothetical protein
MLRTIKAPAKAESMPISLAGLRLNGVKAAQSKLFSHWAGFRNQLLSWRHSADPSNRKIATQNCRVVHPHEPQAGLKNPPLDTAIVAKEDIERIGAHAVPLPSRAQNFLTALNH